MTLKGTPDTAGACDDILTSAYVGAMCCLAECRPKMQPASPSVMDQVSKFVGNLTDGLEGLGGESKSETAPMSIVFVASEVAPWCVSVVPVANPLVYMLLPTSRRRFPTAKRSRLAPAKPLFVTSSPSRLEPTAYLDTARALSSSTH